MTKAELLEALLVERFRPPIVRVRTPAERRLELQEALDVLEGK